MFSFFINVDECHLDLTTPVSMIALSVTLVGQVAFARKLFIRIFFKDEDFFCLNITKFSSGN